MRVMAISARPLEPRDLEIVTHVLTGSWGGSTVMAVGRGVAAERGAARPWLRKLKPAVPAASDGIPIRHDLELPLRAGGPARG